jgi:hypothetical protein
MQWLISSKINYLLWLLVWKIGDIGSTFLVTGKYGWVAEADFTMISQLGPYFGHSTMNLLTLPVLLTAGYFAYERTPVIAEIAVMWFPLITIGNLVILYQPVVGSVMNVSSIVLMPVMYLFRGLKPLWFDRSPTRDELLENIEEVKSWTPRVRSENSGV